MKAALQFPQTKSAMTREAFSGVVLENHATLTAYARMITGGDGVKAGEIVQDAFVTAWQNIGRFDVTRDLPSWLRGIVRNKWREACQRGNREIGMDEETLAMIERESRTRAIQSSTPGQLGSNAAIIGLTDSKTCPCFARMCLSSSRLGNA